MVLAYTALNAYGAPTKGCGVNNAPSAPPPPAPERIDVREIALPPVVAGNGTCTPALNPRGTGCLPAKLQEIFQAGGFLPDGRHVIAKVTFAGAPAAPDPASIYNGEQIIIIKTVKGEKFSNGDNWKCITCGIPPANSAGRTPTNDYPQAFHDGKRILAGTNIIECAEDLASDACTPDKTHVYAIRQSNKADDSGPGAQIRELRIHPDNIHLGFSVPAVTSGKFDQYAYFGRLKFNPAPLSGPEPRAPRYDVLNTQLLFREDQMPVYVDPRDKSQLLINKSAITVGELRGFNGDGREITYVGYPAESSNIDVFAADLTTGAVRRLTQHPEYVDPIDISAHDDWMVVMDTRGTDRQMWLSGLRGIPPVTDLVSTSATSSTRNNGYRRFFQPWLIDRHGDRGDYFGQKLNAAGSGIPGSGAINDPEWNGMADPRWSPDGTEIVYWQAFTVSPACGGANPLPCYKSTAQGGRDARIMIAKLASRSPKVPKTAPIASDKVAWGTPYVPGSPNPSRKQPAPGNYTLKGGCRGSAKVTLTNNDATGSLQRVRVTYKDFSDDGVNVLNGWEDVSTTSPQPTVSQVDWYSDLVQKGPWNGSKKTGPDGFHLAIDVLVNIFNANGTLSTTVGGKKYTQPANGT
ncbi:hypothetical protein BU24DRAFT_360200 [Aaosphaeria arxii CBS 175.79]|uniref:Saponin hydrolase n=1 Tax=Aaosphaeria arxii CBS 175.79 TaxID=1450172 RepID=A0A6A5X6B5_9PLEO|nr:uncharacterized protein BU24DRAFT_360200 [Aaosphaeria arxii CBS 175.79]KAF2008493.1 hypothetical protein BU24DRAFT_360200 [Aaosphaeria arxii CBS 175.79]